MNKVIVSLAVLAVASIARAEKQYLWPEDSMPDAQPHQIAAMTDVTRKEGFVPDQWRKPYLDWFPAPENPNGVCMILISGGSYKRCCDVRYIKEWREALTKLGCQCVNLVYRTPWPENLPFYQTAWEDGQRAVRLVRAEAEKRGFNPQMIGVMSMSAGSHLATLLATSSKTPAYEPVDQLDSAPCNVNWACAFAPAFVLTDGLGKPNTRCGEAVDVALDDCFKFDDATAPMCLLHGGADKHSPNGPAEIYRQLRSHNVPAELHIFPDKGHGAWGFDRAVEFMRQLGYLGKLGREEDMLAAWSSDEARAEYSKVPLWPEGKTPDLQEHQTVPYLEWHIPTNLTTKAIQIIWSGGAYNGCNPNRYEVAPLRRYLNAKGMAVVSVEYRTPRPRAPLAKHTTAWQDAQRAIRIVRHEAASRGLDPDKIGIMGSSAGGHLALLSATTSKTNSYWPIDDIDKESASVAWAICVYPAYVLSDGVNGKNANGGNKKSDIINPEFAFDLATPPILFLHGDADGYSAMGSVKVWSKLRFMGIQGEVHTLVKRGHCFHNKSAEGTASRNWMDRVWDFLKAID